MIPAKRPETTNSPTRRSPPASCGWGTETAKVAADPRRSATEV